MPKTLLQYASWLDGRDLMWSKAAPVVSKTATPSIKPLNGIRAVTWELYGSLLHISEGMFYLLHPQQLRMKIALEKTIEEFNMWNSMYRTKEKAWEYLLRQYKIIVEEMEMMGTGTIGSLPAIDSAKVWRKLIAQLEQKKYSYDVNFYGDFDEFSEKVAYFFHRALQGVDVIPSALEVMQSIGQSELLQGLLSNAQPFSIIQLLRGLSKQGTLPSLPDILDTDCLTLSFREGIRKPSPELYTTALQRFSSQSIEPHEVLHIGTDIQDDLAIAKQAGMKTALFAGNKLCLKVTAENLKDPETRPDRLITELPQLLDILMLR